MVIGNESELLVFQIIIFQISYIFAAFQNFFPAFREGELTKGEAVCLDRCVAKYLDVHEKLGKRLTSISQQDEKQLQQMQQQMQQHMK